MYFKSSEPRIGVALEPTGTTRPSGRVFVAPVYALSRIMLCALARPPENSAQA